MGIKAGYDSLKIEFALHISAYFTLQVVQERDSITISLSGGLKLLNRNSIKSRKLVFHSGLLPFSEKLKIKGETIICNF